MRFFLLFLITFCIFEVKAQSSIPSKFKDYAVVVIAQGDKEFDLRQLTLKSKQQKTFDFYFFSNEFSIIEIADSLNRLLNLHSAINKTHLYLIMAGDSVWIDQYSALNRKLFVKQAILTSQVDQMNDRRVQYYDWQDFDLEMILKDFEQHYQFNFAIINIQDRNEVEVTRDKEKGFGLRSGLNSITGSVIEQDGYLPDFYFDYAFSYFKLYKSRWRLNTELSFTFKRPNPEKVIQEQVMSQVDISSIISDGSIDQDIDLDVEIVGRFGFQFNTDLYYLLSYQKKFNPYLGVGIGLGTLVSFKGAIDTTININIDGSGGFDRSAISGDQDRDLNESNIQQTRMGLPSLNFSAGFQHQWSRKISLDLTAKYLYDLKSVSGENYANRFALNVGLLYRLTGKRRIIYKYF